MADLEYSVANGIGTIRLNRTERKNAFTPEMVDDWAKVLREAGADPQVRVLIVTGAGSAFCSGVELDALDGAATPLQRKHFLTERVHRVPLALEDVDKPVIAAVNGVAVGAGLDMALMCDIRVFARSATVSEGYVRVGLVPGAGGCYYLPRLVGTAVALELMLTGRFVDADEAVSLGLANSVVADNELTDAAYTLARRIAAAPPITVRTIKRAIYQSARSDLRTALDLISSHMGVVASTEDCSEALAAFAEKRAPKFIGR